MSEHNLQSPFQDRHAHIAALEAQLAKLKTDAPPPPAVAPAALKLDFGCGPNKREGFQGVDQYAMPGVDVVLDLRTGTLPWADASVEEAHSSHFIEHLTGLERCHFFNELWRVLKPGAKATIIVPNWSSARAYGDPTHQWPPIGHFTWHYLDKAWRSVNAKHADAEWNKAGYSCDFSHVGGYSLRPDLQSRNPEYIQSALNSQIEAGQDIICTLTKK
jgi:hypothetical protein